MPVGVYTSHIYGQLVCVVLLDEYVELVVIYSKTSTIFSVLSGYINSYLTEVVQVAFRTPDYSARLRSLAASKASSG